MYSSIASQASLNCAVLQFCEYFVLKFSYGLSCDSSIHALKTNEVKQKKKN